MGHTVPVIDLFAGPGGLGEGFSKEESVRFHIAVSIEMDTDAHQTLRLRAAHRQLVRRDAGAASWRNWDKVLSSVAAKDTFESLSSCGDEAIAASCKEADTEAVRLELAEDNREEVTRTIADRLKKFSKSAAMPRNAVLIGGPPCQAYSLVGRARNRGIEGYRAENDPRHYLYREYLHVIAEFSPAVFVMENVRGILSSKIEEREIFETIQRDLTCPGVRFGRSSSPKYKLVSLTCPPNLLGEHEPSDFLIRAEEYGVPQARHRVIILGIREDVYERTRTVPTLRRSAPPSLSDVIFDLPTLRPNLSDKWRHVSWQEVFGGDLARSVVKDLSKRQGAQAQAVLRRFTAILREQLKDRTPEDVGTDRVKLDRSHYPRPAKMRNWFLDRQVSVLSNHTSRGHMPSDILRYGFVAAFSEVAGERPRLSDFPACLLPDHKNIDRKDPDAAPFADRFRAQPADKPSYTITSHISKDGHAFIHPLSIQCRSLSVREAARLQTFPDSYVFLGERTAQYTQVGNAVPPFLAKQIASVVADVLRRAALA